MAMPKVSGAEVVKALSRAGFSEVSQKGSHKKMRHSGGYTTIVPMHREVAPGTLRAIIQQARLTEEEFLLYLEQ
jgi:predicted RNA binding protein YcfA (HicA-like mRNA interferase family)